MYHKNVEVALDVVISLEAVQVPDEMMKVQKIDRKTVLTRCRNAVGEANGIKKREVEGWE